VSTRARAVALAALAAALVATTTTLVAQPVPASGVTETTITFGLEDQVGSFSTDEENLGFRLAFQEANDAGGIHGRTIAWKGYPRRGGDAAAEAVANAKRLVDDDGVLALVNWGGPQAIPILAFAAERRVPYLFPHSALVSSDQQRYLFTSFPKYEGEAAVMFPYLARERGLKRIGIVHDVNEYGRLFLERLTTLAPASGYTVAGNLPIDSRDPGDLTSGLKRLVDAGAAAIVMALYPAQAKRVVEAKGALGWRGTLVSVGPLTDEQYLTVPGGHADGALGFCYYPDPDTSPELGVAAYRAAMAKYHPGRPRNRYSLYGHVYGRLVVEGLRRAGRDLTRERLVDALESIRGWDAGGVMPAVSFSSADHHAQPAGFVCELAAGRFKPLSGWIEP
jgi:ABC-type branched-subunit amino acid transport system substrate-binding protein